MSDRGPIEVADYHTAGEPFRIVVSPEPQLLGNNALERRDYAATHADDIRRLLVNEPRGHADMYGCFVTPPDDDGADLGVVFFHKDGYSTACGHGTIALATWAIDLGGYQLRERNSESSSMRRRGGSRQQRKLTMGEWLPFRS